MFTYSLMLFLNLCASKEHCMTCMLLTSCRYLLHLHTQHTADAYFQILTKLCSLPSATCYYQLLLFVNGHMNAERGIQLYGDVCVARSVVIPVCSAAEPVQVTFMECMVVKVDLHLSICQLKQLSCTIDSIYMPLAQVV